MRGDPVALILNPLSLRAGARCAVDAEQFVRIEKWTKQRASPMRVTPIGFAYTRPRQCLEWGLIGNGVRMVQAIPNRGCPCNCKWSESCETPEGHVSSDDPRARLPANGRSCRDPGNGHGAVTFHLTPRPVGEPDRQRAALSCSPSDRFAILEAAVAKAGGRQIRIVTGGNNDRRKLIKPFAASAPLCWLSCRRRPLCILKPPPP